MFLLLWHVCTGLHGQKTAICDSITYNPASQASFGRAKSDLVAYLEDKIFPILNRHVEKNMTAPSSLQFQFTISDKGNVVGVKIDERTISTECKKELISTLLRMTGWHPAIDKGRRVCSVYDFQIGCLLWIENERLHKP